MEPPPISHPPPGVSARCDQPPIQLAIHRRLTLLASIAMAAIIAPTTAMMGLPVVVPIASFAYGLVMAWLHWSARRGRHYTGTTFGLTLAIIAGCWFPSAGSLGSALVYHSAALVYGVVVLRGRQQTIGVAALFCVTLTLLGVEYAWPGLLPPPPTAETRLVQLASGVILGTGFATLVLAAVLTVHDRERQRLEQSFLTIEAGQRELNRSQATLSALVDSARDMVWLVEPPDFALTRFNGAFVAHCRLESGRAPSPGATPAAIFGEDGATRWIGYYTRALAEGAFTTEHTTPHGRTVLVSCSPVTHDGAVLGVSAIGHDITDMRAQEVARADLERQLLQGQKMESLGRLAGGVAHDFNNMLAVILSSSEYLKEEERDAVRREAIDAIEQAALRSADLTRKLLAFGRRGKNLIEVVSLQSVVRDSLVMLSPVLSDDIRIELDLQETWTIDGDASQLGQIVINLCLNARDAMPRGGPLCFASRDLVQETPAGPREWVEFSVRDAGVGMSDEVKSRIFEPFFSTKSGGTVSGTGLGLATVDGIVHLHGGLITVLSAPQQGSTFIIRFPRGRLQRGGAVAADTPQLASGKILVIDDEPLIRNASVSALWRLGYESMVAADGREGVAVFAEHHASLAGVLLDLKMPRMNGREAFDAMRLIDPGVPVLICTGYGDNDEVQEMVQAGARGLLMKPFRMHEFAASLEKLRA